MAAMTKIVNIRTRVAVRNVNPPICGTVKGIVMTTGDILKCLCKRAQVEEVLPDGRTVKLNMSNYYTDNGAGLDAKKNMPAVEKKITENPNRFKVPVTPVEMTEKQVVETKTEEDHIVEEFISTVDTNPVENNESVEEAAFVTGTTIGDSNENTECSGGIVAQATDVTITNSYNNNHNSGKKNKHKR